MKNYLFENIFESLIQIVDVLCNNRHVIGRLALDRNEGKAKEYCLSDLSATSLPISQIEKPAMIVGRSQYCSSNKARIVGIKRFRSGAGKTAQMLSFRQKRNSQTEKNCRIVPLKNIFYRAIKSLPEQIIVFSC